MPRRTVRQADPVQALIDDGIDPERAAIIGRHLLCIEVWMDDAVPETIDDQEDNQC